MANSGKTSKAIETYFQALSINPSYVRARYNLAISYIHLGSYREAAEHLVTALAIQQRHAEDQAIPANMRDRGVESSNVWNTLKMAVFLLDRVDLASNCDDRNFELLNREFGMVK